MESRIQMLYLLLTSLKFQLDSCRNDFKSCCDESPWFQIQPSDGRDCCHNVHIQYTAHTLGLTEKAHGFCLDASHWPPGAVKIIGGAVSVHNN